MVSRGSIATQLEPALVRVRTSNGETAGVGFLADQGTLLTCAHVVDAALDRDAAEEAPTDPLQVEFVFTQPRAIATARVTRWSPERANDIAVLELDGDAPGSARPLQLTSAGDLLQHRFYAFGFPGGPEGKWAQGRLMPSIGNRWLQLQDDQLTGTRIQSGFSGTPVWDDELGAVVGMIVAEETNAAEKVGYLVPTQCLYETWLGFDAGSSAGDPVLEVEPRILDFGDTTSSAAHHAYVRVTNAGGGDLQWVCSAAGDPIEVHKEQPGLRLRVADRHGDLQGCIWIRSNGGEATVDIRGSFGGQERPVGVLTGRSQPSRDAAVGSAWPALATVEEAATALRAWAAAERGVPDDLFDGDLVVEDATSLRLRVIRLYERREEQKVDRPGGKVPEEEYRKPSASFESPPPGVTRSGRVSVKGRSRRPCARPAAAKATSAARNAAATAIGRA